MRHRRRRYRLLLPLLALLPATSTGDGLQWQWPAGREVRVATAPTLRPLPEHAHDDGALPTLAHGYASLVTRYSGLHFLDQPHPDVQAGIAAVCSHQADLVLVHGALKDLHPPCTRLAMSRGFHGGPSALAGRAGERLPRDAEDLGTLLLATVAGGSYTDWLAEQHPDVRVLPVPNLHAALMAVETGAADAAIGLESTLRPLVRRHFSGGLQLQAIDSRFPTELHLLARQEDQQLLDRIEQALDEVRIDEHAWLLQRWARQSLSIPAGVGIGHPLLQTGAWLLLLLAMLLAAPLLARRLQENRLHRQQRDMRMVGMLSHEVRNSAQAIMASIDLLGQSPLPAGPRELVDAAASASRSLRGVLNRALDFSRLASGTFQPHPRLCDVTALGAQALQAIAPQAQQKALTLTFSSSPDPLPPVAVDPDCLQQLLDNLLGNAIKFTDVGGIEVRAQLDNPPGPATLLLEVIDSGIGIPPQQMATLFQPFQQGESGLQRGGSGLGLSICRELAQAMGGSLDVHSVHRLGSRFILRLPVQHLVADALQDAPVEPRHALAGIHLLLVEDHDLSRRAIAEQLRGLGAEVCAVADAEQALAAQARTPSAVVLLDIGLHDMNGYALAAQLRRLEDDGQPRAQLFALSAHSSTAHAQRCKAADIDAVLTKPLQIEHLLQALGRADALDAGVAGKRDALMAEYEADMHAEMLQLQAAIDARDGVALAHHAHRLQGVLQMCGAADVQTIAGELWALGAAALPDWEAAQRLLRALLAWRDARCRDAALTI